MINSTPFLVVILSGLCCWRWRQVASCRRRRRSQKAGTLLLFRTLLSTGTGCTNWQPDMLTPWGVRTLSEQAYYYNPFMYHCGAVWPFDNAVIAVGLQRYGFNAEARRVAHAILQAFLAIDDPVELYVVLPSSWIRSPRIEQAWALLDYFYASGVQAWTAAA